MRVFLLRSTHAENSEPCFSSSNNILIRLELYSNVNDTDTVLVWSSMRANIKLINTCTVTTILVPENTNLIRCGSRFTLQRDFRISWSLFVDVPA